MPNTNSSELSKVYDESEKVTLEGKKLDKIRKASIRKP